MRLSQAPKLSVCMLAYNQQEHFRQALESAVTQQTNFPFEIIVCDDGSTDGTTEVLREYAERYPQLIRAVYRERNIGHYANFVDAHNHARGDYVAHLDGDDLFLPGKLQRQVDFLDQHPDVSVVWHAMRQIDSDGNPAGRIAMRDGIAPDGSLQLEDAVELGSIGVHSAVMYRASARTTREPDLCVIDWFYAVEFLTHGTGHELDAELGVYRRQLGVSMSSNHRSLAKVRRHFALMILHYHERMPQQRKRLFTLALLIALSDLKAGTTNFLAMRRPLWQCRSWISPREFHRAYTRFRQVSRSFQGR